MTALGVLEYFLACVGVAELTTCVGRKVAGAIRFTRWLTAPPPPERAQEVNEFNGVFFPAPHDPRWMKCADDVVTFGPRTAKRKDGIALKYRGGGVSELLVGNISVDRSERANRFRAEIVMSIQRSELESALARVDQQLLHEPLPKAKQREAKQIARPADYQVVDLRVSPLQTRATVDRRGRYHIDIGEGGGY